MIHIWTLKKGFSCCCYTSSSCWLVKYVFISLSGANMRQQDTKRKFYTKSQFKWNMCTLIQPPVNYSIKFPLKCQHQHLSEKKSNTYYYFSTLSFESSCDASDVSWITVVGHQQCRQYSLWFVARVWGRRFAFLPRQQYLTAQKRNDWKGANPYSQVPKSSQKSGSTLAAVVLEVCNKWCKYYE